MLRPKRMSRVSVTGSKRVMDDTIETVHDLNLLHVTEYDDTWEGFDPGDPVAGAEEAAEKLVTVRALESTLDVSREEAGRTRIIEDAELDAELEETRTRVNDLDDRRAELRDDLREIDDRLSSVRPFAALGIDLDLLTGYDSLTTAVGEGDAGDVREALDDAESVEASEVFSGDGYVAVFAYPASVDVQEAVVGTQFTPHEVPSLEAADRPTSPDEYVDDLRHRRQQVESRLETVEQELEDIRHEVAGFLLAAEEKLSIEVQKREAPLTFATTENAFVAEGWIPTEQYPDLAGTLEATVGDHVEVEELERASFDEDGHAHDREGIDEETGGTGSPGEGAAIADGGYQMSGGQPPVIQDNPDPIGPFEMLVGVINRPKYTELDPTIVLFLTFPVFFGFMIGDVGYGILYAAIGYLLVKRFDSDGIQALGGLALWSGLFTILFGVLYGEFFGLHELGDVVWGGHPPIEKGLSPGSAYAELWLVVSLLIGMAHLSVGWIFDFYENLSHGFADAMTESGSWLLMMFGLWAWIFADAPPTGAAPDLLVTAENGVFAGNPVPLGFTGIPEIAGFVALGAFVVGFVLLVVGEPIESVEFLNVLVHVLSYARIAAVLLAKAGMAFVVNLLVFGAYQDESGNFHFIYQNYGSLSEVHGEVLFPGLLTDASGGTFVIAVIAAALIFVVGHLLVLGLGITSAGLQSIRLEYVEFFGKFYEGGGKAYEPFGYDREFTSDQ